LAAPYLFGFIGNGVTRCVVLALPSRKVRALLPDGLELLEQNVTPPGTHPLIFLFHGFSECQFSFPTLLRSMNFHEQTAGIPFTRVRHSEGPYAGPGPYYFMPKLYLDDILVMLGGIFWWGFSKELASVDSGANRYAVTSLTGHFLASLNWRVDGDVASRPVAEDAEFESTRAMMSQRLISMYPPGVRPVYCLSDFDRRWHLAKVRPIDCVLEVASDYMRGFAGGHFETSALRVPDEFIVCSFELSAPWWLSPPYQAMLPGVLEHTCPHRTWYS
jgi:hypothetical protein